MTNVMNRSFYRLVFGAAVDSAGLLIGVEMKDAVAADASVDLIGCGVVAVWSHCLEMKMNLHEESAAVS